MPVVLCVIRRQSMSDGAVEDIQGGAARVDACCPLLFCAAGWAGIAPTIDVLPISSAFDAMDALISGEAGEVMRVHLLSIILSAEVSYSWAEYEVPAGKRRLLDLRSRTGSNARSAMLSH